MSLDELTKRRLQKLTANLDEAFEETARQAALASAHYQVMRQRLLEIVRAQWSSIGDAMTGVGVDVALDAVADDEKRAAVAESLEQTNALVVHRFIEALVDEIISEVAEGVRAAHDIQQPCSHEDEAMTDAALDAKSRDLGPIHRMDCARRELFAAASGQKLDSICCIHCGKPLRFRTWRPADAVDLGDAGPWTYCRTCEGWGTLFGNPPVE